MDGLQYQVNLTTNQNGWTPISGKLNNKSKRGGLQYQVHLTTNQNGWTPISGKLNNKSKWFDSNIR